jgi:nucleotide-binding universal stress UspA family protein
VAAAVLVIGYDGTEGARAALSEGLGLAGELGAAIALVFSYEKVVVGGEAHDLDVAVAERAAQVLAEGAARAEAAGVAVTTEAREGAPADVLAEVAAERDARMLVIGSYGEAPLRALIVGSTTQRLLRTTDRPVLVVRTRR